MTCLKESRLGFNLYANISQILVPHNPLFLCLNLCPVNAPLNLTSQPHRITSNTSIESIQYLCLNHYYQFLTNINCNASTSTLISPTHITHCNLSYFSKYYLFHQTCPPWEKYKLWLPEFLVYQSNKSVPIYDISLTPFCYSFTSVSSHFSPKWACSFSLLRWLQYLSVFVVTFSFQFFPLYLVLVNPKELTHRITWCPTK